jgi:hypothetical protein
MPTKKEIKIEKRNELLKAFNPEATNIETIKGLGVTFYKNTVRIVEQGAVIKYKVNQIVLENQPINYIIKPMNIKELKKELGLSNSDIAKFFGLTQMGYANSSAKDRYDTALCLFYAFCKKASAEAKEK